MLVPFLLLFLSFLQSIATSSSYPITLPNCLDRCGDLNIPYPFGTKPGCSLPGFLVRCDFNISPPRLYLDNEFIKANHAVTSISLSSATVTVLSNVTRSCYNSTLKQDIAIINMVTFTLTHFFLSSTRNKFTGLGCSTIATSSFSGFLPNRGMYTMEIQCSSFCKNLKSVINGSCLGVGCCQSSIPTGVQEIIYTMHDSPNSSINTLKFSPCRYSFIVDDQYVFQVSDLTDYEKMSKVPVVLDWAVGSPDSCETAKAHGGYACGNNSYCRNSTNAPGYQCSCLSGYEGNPYLANGCQDINECDDPKTSLCSEICENTLGSYNCFCPRGYSGDGKKPGNDCYKKTFPLIQLLVGSGVGLLFSLVCGFILYLVANKRRMTRQREKFFKENGGFLLQQQLAKHEAFRDETARIFSAEELKRATDNYADSRTLGQGGNGTVYRGILPESGHVVAIKKSHIADATQIEQFINEVVLLSQVIHRNVVRILGCCLETQVPLLVYEYVSNGTLHYHLHARPGSLSWEARLQIAAETAGALAYLHSSIARPIFHRDVKAANILLNDTYTAKVSDFGASRMIPIDRAHDTTLVQGTLGYLDPEYFQTGQLTEKSDVYSFGVVLAEMMTGQKPISDERTHAEKNLAIYFLLKIREGKLQEILEHRVKTEGSIEQLEAISELARRCMRLNGEERPTIWEVASDIERIRRPERVDLEAVASEELDDDHNMLINEINEGLEESESTRFYSSMITRVMSEMRTRYFAPSAIGDDSLDHHIMLSLEMQR